MTDHHTPDGWLISTEDDGSHGFAWFASHRGVLWAKGWMRTRSEPQASAAGEIAGRTALCVVGVLPPSELHDVDGTPYRCWTCSKLATVVRTDAPEGFGRVACDRCDELERESWSRRAAQERYEAAEDARRDEQRDERSVTS